MRRLSNAADLASVEARLALLRAESPSIWGVMTPGGMVCHLCDSFRFALGERPVEDVSNFVRRTFVKWVALHTSLPWPKGIATRPEVDQRLGGTRPVQFERDCEDLVLLMRRFVEPVASRPPHPIFGLLTEDEWQHWGWRHADHHLRQFGV